jgi:WD40 repeat protein
LRAGTEVTAALFTPDGHTLIVADQDGFISFRDVARDQELLRVDAHKNGVYGLALSADGKQLASAGADRLVRVWDIARVKEVSRLEGHEKEAIAVAFAPDGKLLASGGYDGTVRLWDPAAGKELRALKEHSSKVTAVAFAPDGKTLASGGIVPLETPNFRGSTHGDRIHIWEAATGNLLRKLPVGGTRLAFAPDGHALISSEMYLDPNLAGQGRLVLGGISYDGGSRVSIWDPIRAKERLKLEEYWTAFGLSADGRFLATGWGSRLHGGGIVLTHQSRNKGIHLWELATAKEVLHFAVPENQATVLAMSPDGTRLAAGQADGTVKLWDLAPTGWKALAVEGLGPKDWETRWQALAGEDTVAAYEAIWTLVPAGDKAAAFIKVRLQPVAQTDARIPQLVADLDSKQFAVRQAADKELRKLGGRAEHQLRQTLSRGPSLEVRRRIEGLLQAIEDPKGPEVRRQGRALHILERMTTRGARDVLVELAKGSADAPLTWQAREALARLNRRERVIRVGGVE